MRAGRLRQRVTIREKSVTRGDYGAETVTWTAVATVWASVEPLRGREFLEAQREGAEVTTKVVMRYRGGIVPEMQVTYSDHTYDVLAVIHVDERGRELQLMCREVL